MAKIRTHIAPGYVSDDFVQVGDPIDGQAVGGTTPAAGTFTVLTATEDLRTAAGTGTAAAVAGLAVTEHGTPYHHCTEFTFSGVEVGVTHGSGSNGYGTLKIYDFPARALGRQGTRLALSAVGSSGGVNASAAFALAFGTSSQASANSGSVVANGDNFSASGGTAVTLSGGAATDVKGMGNLNGTLIDGVAAARSLYINLAGVDTSSNGTVTLTGTLFVAWTAI